MWSRPIQSTYTVFSLSDPAIDLDACKREERKIGVVDGVDEYEEVLLYRESLDKAHLAFRPGMVATEFDLAPLTTRQKAMVTAKLTASPGDYLSFYDSCAYSLRCSLRAIRGFKVGDSDLVVMRGEDGLVLESVIDQLGDPNLVVELSSYARELSHIPFQCGQASAI